MTSSAGLYSALCALGLGLAGCGGSAGSGLACGGTFTPCGGDITGTWSVEHFCGTPPGLESCPTATAKFTGVKWVGTLTFTPDSGGAADRGTASEAYNASLDSTIVIPSACLPPTKTCATMQGLDNATCTEEKASVGTSCVCDVHTDNLSSGSDQNYTTSGNGNVDIGFGGNYTNYVYCVSGNTLTLSTSLTDGPGVTRLTFKRTSP